MKKHLLTLISFIYILTGFTQEVEAPRIEFLQLTVKYLASDELKGRETGTKEELLAANYIAKQFETLQIEPKGTDGYLQAFTFLPKSNPHVVEPVKNGNEITGYNVVAFLNNKAKTTIVIGAHYDHLGLGGEGSLHADKNPAIHNGADDNASGVALMLDLAAQLKTRTDLANNNYLFIAFSGEEKGLFGSNFFSKNPTVDIGTINYMINLDMVGRYRTDKGIAINGTGTSPLFKKKLDIINTDSLTIVGDESGVGPSDHTSFYLKDIPVLHFFTGQHEDYHKPTDDFEKVNFEGIELIADFILKLITSLNWDGKIEFSKTKDENSHKAPKFSVTLGVMPDYMFAGKGMKIDGIIDDRPGQKAGLKTGDIVKQIGDIEVVDMKTYMEALGKFNKGDKTTAIIERENKQITVNIQF